MVVAKHYQLEFTMKSIVILGGGEAGFTIAKGLESKLKADEATITLVDKRSHNVYQPFLAEVASGAIGARHIQVPFHQHLSRTEVVCAKVTGASPEAKEVYLENKDGDAWTLSYDILVVTLGAVTKTFPTPGIAENAVGLKSVEEAVYIRNKLIDNFNRVSSMYKSNPRRKKLLTFVVVGGGFSGVEGFAEMRDLATDLLKHYPSIDEEELSFHLIEASDRIMPEIPREQSAWVIDQLEKRGAHVHLNTFVTSAVDGVVKTSTDQEYPTELIVWTAGSLANPVLKEMNLPLDERGRLCCRTDMRVEGPTRIYDDVFGCGDCTRIMDESGGGLPDGTCAPTAQHAMRQAKVLTDNLVKAIRGGKISTYYHANAGCVAGLGVGLGIFASGKKRLIIKGPLAWLAHRGYHGLALPTWERKLRVFGDWTANALLGRDLTPTIEGTEPKRFFQEFAAKPKE